MPIILNDKDKEVCEQIAKGQESIYKKRAIALLSIENGNTQVKAAEDSSLSVGQVRYFLSKYKALGIACFPDDIVGIKVKEEPINEPTVTLEDVILEEEKKVSKKKKNKTKEKKKEKTKEKEPIKKVSKKKDKKNKDEKKNKIEKNKEKKTKKKKNKKKEK